jgi:hypothetical protein
MLHGGYQKYVQYNLIFKLWTKEKKQGKKVILYTFHKNNEAATEYITWSRTNNKIA